MITRNTQNTELRVRKSCFVEVSLGRNGFKIFSDISAAGARSVAEAVDMIAERSAQKNITCMKRGVFSSMSVGSTR